MLARTVKTGKIRKKKFGKRKTLINVANVLNG